MKLLGIRYCTVSKQAEAIASFLGAAGLGLPERDMGASESFQGAVFPASDSSWVEVWPEMDGFSAMPCSRSSSMMQTLSPRTRERTDSTPKARWMRMANGFT